jgi:hypothetical protein
MMLQEPEKALHTGAIIQAAGREDVCSICGYGPAADYILVEPAPEDDQVSSLRLCEECLGFRAKDGEMFRPAGGQ